MRFLARGYEGLQSRETDKQAGSALGLLARGLGGEASYLVLLGHGLTPVEQEMSIHLNLFGRPKRFRNVLYLWWRNGCAGRCVRTIGRRWQGYLLLHGTVWRE